VSLLDTHFYEVTFIYHQYTKFVAYFTLNTVSIKHWLSIHIHTYLACAIVRIP